MLDIYVYRIDLPKGVREMVSPDTEDDGYTIYIDRKLSRPRALQSLKHALWHCINNDFEKEDADAIEAAAHRR